MASPEQSPPPPSQPGPGSSNSKSNTASYLMSATTPEGDLKWSGTPPLVHNMALAAAVLGPIALVLPGKTRARFSLQNTICTGGSFWAINQLAFDYSGKSIMQRSSERWGAMLRSVASADALPSKAEQNRRLMEAERAKMRREELGLPPTAVLEDYEYEEDGTKKKAKKERGFIGRLWWGDEDEDWMKKRLQREKEALESGKGYSDLILEQIWDVWNQNWRAEAEQKKKDDELKRLAVEQNGKETATSGKDGK
ncbi:hypothetical protein B0H66DRAFT_599886 [Apodospora peruviana]|uniref:Rhomboid family membrane protein n=1 Tax=Apodospora peruviana TaxID=516989 RepID=A0AAE0MC94_9PEZI|nr:hypothetical protein B0H66DRAFT_599886 [Apodospora peruviana]